MDDWKVFNDNVHGHIRLHPLCMKVIDTPEFQRLRNIKQLGATYLVFPGATHSRFEHSIGVSYLAERLVTTLRHSQPELDITDIDVACVALAGLCHDLGHGPFSHLWERFMLRVRPDHHWKHERASVLMFTYLLKQNNLLECFYQFGLSAVDICFIEEQIADCVNSADHGNSMEFTGRDKSKHFLYEIIYNRRNGIDVDKWDYICRDSMALGMKMSFDFSRCLLYSRVINVGDTSDWQICTRDKEVENMYDMFYSRWLLHRRAYQHRTVRAIEAMIIDILVSANDHLLVDYAADDGTPAQCSMAHACDCMRAFTTLSDTVLDRIAASHTCAQLLPARRLCLRLLRRQLYSVVGWIRVEHSGSHRRDGVIADIYQQLDALGKCEHLDWSVEVLSIDYGMSTRNPIDHLRFYSKQNPSRAISIRREQVSHMLPQIYQDMYCLVISRDMDNEALTRSYRCIRDWSTTQQFITLSREPFYEMED